MAFSKKKVAAVLALAVIASAALASTYWYQSQHQSKTSYQCQWRKVSGPGEDEGLEIAETAELKLEIQAEQELLALSATSGMHNGREGGYGDCSLNWEKQAAGSEFKLSRAKNKFILSSQEEKFEVIKTNNGYRFNIIKANVMNCGMGWNWPRAIEVNKNQKTCIVRH